MAKGRTALGRPTKSATNISEKKIYREAFRLLAKGGLSALTFRALAKKLGVTPMAITHHVGNRKQMLSALIALAFSDICLPAEGESPQARLKFHLVRYCECATANAHLIQAVLYDTSLFDDKLSEFTSQIQQELEALVDKETVTPVLHLIIDYTHGFINTVASAPADRGPSQEGYIASLSWILDHLYDG